MNSADIDALVQKVRDLPDSGARDAALELAQAIVEFHGAGLERMLDVIAELDGGIAAIDAAGADPLVSSMLLLHDLHPLDLEGRVARSLDRPEFRTRGASVELLSVSNGEVRVRIEGGPQLRAAVEAAISEAAPDASGISVEGGGPLNATGFVPLAQLIAGGA